MEKKKNKFEVCLSKLKADYWLYIMLIPFLLYYIMFLYKPMYGLIIAFKDYSLFKGITGSPWVGFANFKEFFGGPYFGRILKNTFSINIINLLWTFPMPIILAVLFNEVRHKGYQKTVQTLTYLPHFVSVVVVVGIATNLLSPSSGLINLIIEKFGGEKVYFLSKPEYFRTIYVFINLWKGVGFSSIIYFAALAGIDTQLYEAAVVDGANKWKQLTNVTLPGIAPTVVVMLIMQMGSLIKSGYETILLLYQPATYETADVIGTYVYRAGILNSDYETATVAGIFESVVALVLTITANRISKQISETSLW